MRKFLWVVAVAGLVLTLAAPAIALDFKFGGEYRIRFFSGQNVGGNSPSLLFDHNDPNRNVRGVQLRVRPRFDVSDDNGNITATLRLEIGDIEWGNGGGAQGVTNGVNQTPGSARVGNGSGGSLGADGVNVETKWAYLDFALPWGIPARLRAGIQPWFLPKGIIVDDDVVGLRAYGTTKPISYEMAWYRTSSGPNANPGTPPAGSAGRADGVGGVGISGTASQATDNNFDWYQFRVDYAAATWLNAGLYGLYGKNAATTYAGSTVADASFIGFTATGKVGIVSYDFDFVYGQTQGGPNGNNASSNTCVAPACTPYSGDFTSMVGYGIDTGVHFPIGPMTIHLVGSAFTGDRRNGGNSDAFPYISPSWNGAGGLYEIIGSGGAFDALDMVQDAPTNLWMGGFGVEYRPVKALWTRIMYGYAGFASSHGNCASTKNNSAGVNTPCMGPSYARESNSATYGKSGTNGLGQEISLRADWDLYTGFKVQGAFGVLIPNAGAPATETVLQFLYNF